MSIAGNTPLGGFLRGREDSTALRANHILSIGPTNLVWLNLVIAVRAGRLD